MSGSEFATGIVPPSGTGLPWPGSTSTNMSFRAVFGRSSAVASCRIRFLYSGLISSVTTATPSSSFTSAIRPTSTPATRTVWPWPGCTACAFASSISICFGFASHEREAEVLLAQQVHARSRGRAIATPTIARKSLQCFLMASFTARLRRASRRRPARSGSADPASRTARPAGAAAACSRRAARPARSCPVARLNGFTPWMWNTGVLASSSRGSRRPGPRSCG